LPLLFTHRLCYELIGSILSQDSTDYGRFLITSWDLAIPYIPVFVLPYLFTWVYACFIILYTIMTGTYRKNMFRYFYLSILIETGVECLIWYNFPASILIRANAEAINSNGWLGGLTAYVYERATPWNVIPSAHIAFSYTVWLFSKHFAPKPQRSLFLLLFIFIVLSVVFIKNHYLIDIAGGMVLGHLVYLLVFLPASKHKILDGLSTPVVLSFYCLVFFLATVIYQVVLGYSWSL
jgi:membrane-associated phospholipid phosphatase